MNPIHNKTLASEYKNNYGDSHVTACRLSSDFCLLTSDSYSYAR